MVQPYLDFLMIRKQPLKSLAQIKTINNISVYYIYHNDLAENDARFKAPYNIEEPIETLIEQINDAIDYADAGNQAYTPRQIIIR